MTWRCGLFFLVLTGLSGCKLLQHNKVPVLDENQVVTNETKQEQEPAQFCISPPTESLFEHNCNIAFWLQYRSQVENLTWQQRKAAIEGLGSEPNSMLKKILLSQAKETPYTDRLRAQRWIESILPIMTEEMRSFLNVMVYQTSLGLLELESALVTLGRLNSSLSQTTEEQKLMIEKQKSQIEQLLKIEASIMANENGDKR